MNSILSQISDPSLWRAFMNFKLERGRLSWREYVAMEKYVNEKCYQPVLDKINRGEGLSLPRKKIVNKMGSGKKRVVYSYRDDEMMVLRLIAFLLYRYDDKLSDNCYSFRAEKSAQSAVLELNNRLKNGRWWCYKTDIHNYFNSIKIPLLLPILNKMLADDKPLFDFFERMLTEPCAVCNGEIVTEEKGVMAGTPVSPFLANIYLVELDDYFAGKGIVYARYSDDVVVFAPTEEELQEHRNHILDFIARYGLEVNPEKEKICSPDEPFEFLGFRCLDGKIDISEATKRKLKGKIRRKAHTVRRKMSADTDVERIVQRFIGSLNRLFFDEHESDELTWSRWFFPVINKADGLKEIDAYVQQNIRFVASGRNNKRNYNLRYADMKRLGYRGLVNGFYKR